MEAFQKTLISDLNDWIRHIQIEGDEAMEEILCELIDELGLRLEQVRSEN
jgi:hypothetical protein